MRDLSPSFLQNKGFVNYIYHVSKGSGVRQIGMGSLAKDKPTPRSGKTLIFLGETRIYVSFLRRSAAVSRGAVRRKGAAPLPRDAGPRPGCGRRSPGRRPASRARRRKEKTKRSRR